MVEYSRPLTASVRIIFWKQQVEGIFGRSRPPPPRKKKQKQTCLPVFYFEIFFSEDHPTFFYPIS